MLKQKILHGSSQPELLQSVATVYIDGKEYRVYAPPDAKGDTLDWVPHFTVRQFTDFNSEAEIHDALGVLAVRVVKEKLEKQERDANRKPRPEHVAQICRNGHLVLSSLKESPQFRKSFCEDCGAATIEECQACGWPIAGIGPLAWMGGGGPYQPPRYCGECGEPFPWTETALTAAKEYTDHLDQLSPEEKTMLKGTFDDLTSDTPRTALAANRFKRFISKIAPGASGVLQKMLKPSPLRPQKR
ncbi:MAG TPA: DUF2321 domain-containing protein [Terriglobia bacterium]|nr:DUF2321 domain-containing protein [Terriglobia bacterium]